MSSFTSNLESRLSSRSEILEEIHFEAAIDAQLTSTSGPQSNSRPVITAVSSSLPVPPAGDVDNSDTIVEGNSKNDDNANDENSAHPAIKSSNNNNDNDETVIFDDYVNPNAVSNCLSPFVPSSSDRIDSFFKLTKIHGKRRQRQPELYDKSHHCREGGGDVLLDIGCGDGRVCISAAKITGCKAVGIDISPPCIKMAREVSLEEGLGNDQCAFFEADATIDPDILLSESSPLHKILHSVTVVFLYTYPTLLKKLIPLLSVLTDDDHNVRMVGTLTYHLPENQVVVNDKDDDNDIWTYSRIYNDNK